jgi:hypothetical protein
MLRVMMNTLPASDLTFDGPAAYRIRVRGRIPARWRDRVEGMVITVATDSDDVSVTTLAGELGDQASLAGVLNMLYELRLPVLAVEHLPAG